MLKGDQLSDVVRASSELGVTTVQLLITDHTVVRDIGATKLERLRRIATEAAKQCQRATIPEVIAPVTLSQYLTTCLADLKTFAHPYGQAAFASLYPLLASAQHVAAVIGPEGGLSERECRELIGSGWYGIGLGPRILRAETAPIAVVAGFTALRGV
jgi:16S rRNA (uracil1498-N3)-methyltransferase